MFLVDAPFLLAPCVYYVTYHSLVELSVKVWLKTSKITAYKSGLVADMTAVVQQSLIRTSEPEVIETMAYFPRRIPPKKQAVDLF